MAREFASIHLSIWDDDDFRALPPPQQHLYFITMISPTLNYAGVLDWRPGRLAAMSAGWSAEAVETAARVLEERLYLVIDRDTEEALVRSFVRRDGLMKNPRMAVSMANAHAGIASAALRGVVVHELKRLHESSPDLKGWKPERVKELLSKGSVDPSTYPCLGGSVTPPANPSATPTVKGSVTPKPSEAFTSPLLLAPATAPSSLPPNPSLRSGFGSTASLRSAGDEPANVDPQAVVAAWVEACEANDVKPSSGQRSQVGRLAKELLAAGNDPARVLAAARAAAAKGYATIDRELTTMASRQSGGGPTGEPVGRFGVPESELPVFWREENDVSAMQARGEL